MSFRKLFCLLSAAALLLTGCANRKTSGEGSPSTDATGAVTAAAESESAGETEAPGTPVGALGTENAPGCFYGADTGTDKTYTGLEPLALNPFNGALDPPEQDFSTKRIEYSYGVAKNGEPHEISVSNQRFFDENGFNALCLDTKTTEKVVYLTFDCGYENGYTGKILDTLRDKGVNAAFFCTLPQMRENCPLIARMIKEGHIVGNHSVTHPDFSELSRGEMLEEVKGFDDFLREHFGYSSFYFRYPQGKYSEDSLDMLGRMGYRSVFWSLAYADWDLNDQKGADFAAETVLSRLHPGAVILLHAVSPDNAEGLAKIIDGVRGAGYEFRALSAYPG